jgi:hypothetical protein
VIFSAVKTCPVDVSTCLPFSFTYSSRYSRPRDIVAVSFVPYLYYYIWSVCCSLSPLSLAVSMPSRCKRRLICRVPTTVVRFRDSGTLRMQSLSLSVVITPESLGLRLPVTSYYRAVIVHVEVWELCGSIQWRTGGQLALRRTNMSG